MIRLRDRSSSQIATPSLGEALECVCHGIASPTCRAVSVSAAAAARDSRAASRPTFSAVKPNSRKSDLGVGRSAEVLQRNDASGVADEAVPGQADAGLDRDAGLHGRRQHAVPVPLVLLLEPLHDGIDTTRVGTPVGLELLARLDGELHLGAGADEDRPRGVAALGLEQHVTALGGVLVGARTSARPAGSAPGRAGRPCRTPWCSA